MLKFLHFLFVLWLHFISLRHMKFRLILPLLLVLFLSSCTEYNRIQKGRDMDAKLDLAIRLYKKGQYFKALPLLEELITIYRGTKKAEETYYYYAYTNYNIGDYESAAYDFDNFSKTFPSSEFAEECAYMKAYCFFRSSPDYTLDQTNTYKAINNLQLFADRYPSSTRLDQCNKLIDQLRFKLEMKNYDTALMYLNMEEFRAAITTFKNLLSEFPGTRFREDALFKSLKAAYLLAENSIEEKKQERYNQTLLAYTEFINAYPGSKNRDKADDYYNQALKRLDKLSIAH